MDLILVDENDVEIGASEKHSAHNSRGSLHRSFSVLLFNYKKELLIQQRSSKNTILRCVGLILAALILCLVKASKKRLSGGL